MNPHLLVAIEAAEHNVAHGGGPFGAVVVAPDGRTFVAANRVTANNDPTAHAEIMAIRLACRELGTFDLSGCLLYASCQPCPMCLAACQWARLDRVEYAATTQDAAAVGFDDSVFHAALRGEVPLPTPVCPASAGDATADDRAIALQPFRAWSALESRVRY